MTDLDQHEAIQVFVGIEVGKSAHHTVALNRAGKRLRQRSADEPRLRALIAKHKEHGPILLVGDQPTTANALPVAVAHQGALIAYLPGLPMRRIAEPHAR